MVLPAHHRPVSPGRQPQRSWEQARGDEAVRALRSASTPEARPRPAASGQQRVSFEDSMCTMSQATQPSSVVSSGGGAWRPGSDRRSSGSGERLLLYFLNCVVSLVRGPRSPGAPAPTAAPPAAVRTVVLGVCRGLACAKAFGRAVWCCHLADGCITLPA